MGLWDCCIHLKLFTVCSGCKRLQTEEQEALRRPAGGDGGVGFPRAANHI